MGQPDCYLSGWPEFQMTNDVDSALCSKYNHIHYDRYHKAMRFYIKRNVAEIERKHALRQYEISSYPT
jgi:hypothetical protein